MTLINSIFLQNSTIIHYLCLLLQKDENKFTNIKKTVYMKNFYSCMALGLALMPANGIMAQSGAMTKQQILKVADGKELLGNIIDAATAKNNGIYKFAIANIDPKPVVTGSKIIANAGSVYYDNHFKFISADYTYAAQGQTSANLFDYVVGENDAWSSTGTHKTVSIDMVAEETAYDRKTGKVYGVFYKNQDLNETEFGIADYNTLTRTTIGPATKKYVAIGLSSDLTMYGIASDGNLYKINTATGSETLVGATGLNLIDADGKTYAQSGEIDQRDNTFYWAATDANGKSGLYTVDLTTGAATLLNSFPNNEMVYALSIPYPEAEENAPGKVTNLKATFEKDNTEGTVSFRTPNVTFGGDVLEGDVDYYVTDGNDTITGKAAAGTRVNVSVTGKAKTTNTYTVWAANSIGAGPKKEVQVYVGMDSPKYSISNVALEADATGKLTLTWDELAGTHGGYIGDVKYTVLRNGTETAAEDLTENSFSEDINVENGMAAYYYKVTAKCGTTTANGKSNVVILGNHVDTPFETSFDTEKEFNIFAISDGNGDGTTWKYSSSAKAAQYSCSYTNAADDWFITPPAKVEEGKVYDIRFSVKESNSKYVNKLNVKYGNTNKVSDMLDDVFDEPIEITSNEEKEYSFRMTAARNTTLSLGFYVTSDKNMGSVSITKFSIKEDDTNAISEARTSNDKKINAVYSLDGRLISNSTNTDNLAKGLYIINNKKVLVK